MKEYLGNSKHLQATVVFPERGNSRALDLGGNEKKYLGLEDLEYLLLYLTCLYLQMMYTKAGGIVLALAYLF